MPRYYFDIEDDTYSNSERSRDLLDVAAARAEALRVAIGYVDPSQINGDGGAIVIAVRDEAGDVVMNVRLVFTVETRTTHESSKSH